MANSDVTLIFRQDAPVTATVSSGPPETDRIKTDMNEDREFRDGRKPLSASLENESRLLKFLESNSGLPVSRDEILRHVWPELPLDRVMADQTIDKAVARLRNLMEDDPRRPKRLITVGEYGFLLAEPGQR